MLHGVIMAGGSGTRFWPKSRKNKPKQLQNIFCKRTMIQETLHRIKPLIDTNNTLVITGSSHAGQLKKQIPEIPDQNIIIEPVGRNTAPCIGLAALYIKRKDPHGVMAVLAADHLIKDEREFLNVLSVAKRVAEEKGYLITLGIRPKKPETGYGYIQYGEEILDINNKRVFKVNRFIEKPEKEVAEKFLSSENYLWNSGMFIWKADTILKMIEIHLPELYQGLMRIDNVISTDKEGDTIEEVYSCIENISIDYGIMEKIKDVVVIPCDPGWSDVGSWNSLPDVLPCNEHGNVITGKHIGIDTTGSIIHAPHKLIATIGIKDMIIIETEDALLICPRERGEDVKRLVESIKEKKMDEYL